MTLRRTVGLELWCRVSRYKRRSGAASLAQRGAIQCFRLYIQLQVLRHLSSLGELMMLCCNLRVCVVMAALTMPMFAQSSSQFSSLALSPNTSSTRWPVAAERHLQDGSTAALLSDSAFAHGYRHGYDEGFHLGDLDIHMGRPARVATGFKAYRQAGREYNNAFGSKELFDQGYQAGVHSGYSDAMAGFEYRASRRTREAAEGLSVLPPSRRKFFDEGFAGGYKSAQTHDAPATGITSAYLEQYCEKTAAHSHPLEYCSGFSRGYLLGMFSAPPSSGKIASSHASAH
jgi:hypothetical protein